MEIGLPNKKIPRDHPALIIFVLMGVIANISVLLRLVSRNLNKVRLWWDDYILMLALVCN